MSGCLLVAALAPVWLLLLPFGLLWHRIRIRMRRDEGFVFVTPGIERTLRAYAEAWISTSPPAGGWRRLTEQTDRFFALAHARSSLVPVALFTLMEWAPVLTLRLPFSRLSLRARRAVIDRHYLQRGLLSPLTWTRQISRLGYHSTQEQARRGGFVPVANRSSGSLAGGVRR